MQRTRGAVVWVVVLAVSAWADPVRAAPNPWPFDFDPQLADDPAAIQAGLAELGQGLPGLPDDELTEVQLGPVSLYLWTGLADALDRAVDAGPGLMPDAERPPVICAAHEAFVYPSLLISPATPECVGDEQTIAAAFADNAMDCTQVEYPETYVYEHPPGFVDTNTVSSFSGLIAVAGEALRHLSYPVGLLPADFLSRLRPIIVKIRYTVLLNRLTTRLASYATASQLLSSSSACFDPGARASLESTIIALTAELNEARQELDQIVQDGLTQAAADQAEMQNQCRARGALLHPALTDEERVLLSFYIGGIFWRARGAGLLAYPPDPEQGTLRRLLYVKYPYQLVGDLTGGDGAEGVGNNILIDENWGWDEWWDMGTTPGSADKYSDLVGMTNRGKRGVNLVGQQLAGRGYDTRALLAGGLQMGPCYYYAWELLSDFRLGDDLQPPYMWFIEWPTSIGEFCAGAALAEGLARTLLWGTTIPPEECASQCPEGGCPDGGVADGSASCGPCPDGQACNASGVCEPLGEPSVDPDDPAGSGCGCASRRGAGLPGASLRLMLGVLLWWVRRARAR